MAKIICTQAEYDMISLMLKSNPEFLKNVSVIYDIVQESSSTQKEITVRYEGAPTEDTISRNDLISELTRCINLSADDTFARGRNQGILDSIVRVRHIVTVTSSIIDDDD